MDGIIAILQVGAIAGFFLALFWSLWRSGQRSLNGEIDPDECTLCRMMSCKCRCKGG